MRKTHQRDDVFVRIRCGGFRVLRRVAVSCLANLNLKGSSPTHTNFLFLGFPKAAMVRFGWRFPIRCRQPANHATINLILGSAVPFRKYLSKKCLGLSSE